MLPGLSDTIMTMVIGGIGLKVASVVLIFLLAFTIALGGFTTLLMIHCKTNSDHCPVLAVMIRGAIVVAISMIALAILATLVFPGSVGQQSLLFLVLCLPRPFMLVWNVFHREILFKLNQHKAVQQLTSKSIVLYIGVSWLALGLTMLSGFQLSIMLVLCGSYASMIFTAVKMWIAVPPADRLTTARIFTACTDAFRQQPAVTGIGSAVANSATNVLEIGFLAVVGWLAVNNFPAMSNYYYPMFNMFEWASALAIGLSRVYTERRIARLQTPTAFWLVSVLTLYSFGIVALYLLASTLISSSLSGAGGAIYFFAVFYVLFDGLQLVLRSHMLAQETGGELLNLSLLSYTLSLIVIVMNWLMFKNTLLVYASLLLPLLLSNAFLIYFSTNNKIQIIDV